MLRTTRSFRAHRADPDFPPSSHISFRTQLEEILGVVLFFGVEVVDYVIIQ